MDYKPYMITCTLTARVHARATDADDALKELLILIESADLSVDLKEAGLVSLRIVGQPVIEAMRDVRPRDDAVTTMATGYITDRRGRRAIRRLCGARNATLQARSSARALRFGHAWMIPRGFRWERGNTGPKPTRSSPGKTQCEPRSPRSRMTRDEAVLVCGLYAATAPGARAVEGSSRRWVLWLSRKLDPAPECSDSFCNKAWLYISSAIGMMHFRSAL
jgi:hypothetical protein